MDGDEKGILGVKNLKGEKMNEGKVVGGLILLGISIYSFIFISGLPAKLGGPILGILGLASLIRGIKEKK